MATTAAGVAAGAFLFQGISSLVVGHHNSPLAGASPLSAPAADMMALADSLLDAPTDTFAPSPQPPGVPTETALK